MKATLSKTIASREEDIAALKAQVAEAKQSKQQADQESERLVRIGITDLIAPAHLIEDLVLPPRFVSNRPHIPE